MITSQKEVIEYLEKGFKLEESERFRSYVYYLTNRKDKEINVSRKVILKLKEKGVIDFDNDYKKGINVNDLKTK